MKATELERKSFDKSLDGILELFNNLEEDVPIILFSDDVIENIERAKEKYGNETINQKINAIVGEMLSWLSLEETDNDSKEEDTTDNDS
ncbi:atypical membrane-integrating protein (Mistic protein) [Virgibacillus sp. NKC19-3]|uniref:atypical membrane-integrating protein (Mistic protein) n=1 Tax=Virgibacillus saliphilus TaxID=2831674 RepID=UPI001C9AC0F7|nr:atypical membrane-integrating protein (Mistic protein) [Virgibacillus sp. NKC19-3]MBY7143144.1 atypical membrane-integrating protein (Mistic protein) [Virgibacillus sp. NKC19-3]